MTNESFIRSVKGGAITSGQTHGILPSITIAQAILESDWGRSELARKANALFGIKASNWSGKTYRKQTWEVVNEKSIKVWADFRAYKSWEESIIDHGEFLQKPRYAKVVGEKNYKKAAQELRVAGYATDPAYPSKLVGLIEKYSLHQFDDMRGDANMANHVGVNSGYEYITKHNARNLTKGRGKYGTPKAIVIHHWDDPKKGPTFNGVVDWFCKNPACSNSAHYVVEGGRVACVVGPYDTAWHAGNWDMNQKSLGLECSPYQTDVDYETVGELVADLWLEWGKLPLYRHKDVSDTSTACPGTWNMDRIKQVAEKHFNANSSKPDPEGTGIVPEGPSDWAKEAWEEATKAGIVDGNRPLDPITREEYAASELRRLKQ